MLSTFAVSNYRSLRQLVVPLGPLNVVTGANGSGKSNLYRALRLVSQIASGGVISSLAREGGLPSTFWAGPETLSKRMKQGTVPVQGGPRQEVVRMRLGFADETFGYSISLGLPTPHQSQFALDPQIKRECIWAGPVCRPASLLADRNGAVVRLREGRSWAVASDTMREFDSMLSHVSDATTAPEILALRRRMTGWRFYDQFRTDERAPSRTPQLGTRTAVLHHDGRDLAAALQTIREIGDARALNDAVSDAFPGARVDVQVRDDAWFSVVLHQHGLLRPLAASEFSDGTLRYLLLVAALLTPRPPELMVLNEPETSLHPDLLPALARLIGAAAVHSQVWVVSHAARLIAALKELPGCQLIGLDKQLGETQLAGFDELSLPPWTWPD